MSYWDDKETSIEDFRDTDEFAAYRKQVLDALEQFARPVSIREIHERIGRDLAKWTADVLETTSYILRIPGYVDFYSYEPNIRTVKGMTPEEGNSLPFVANKNRFNAAKVRTDGTVTV